MKLSIFTPTHNTKYLKELEQTVLTQSHTDWEWIILVNNGAKYKSIDNRIKVIESKQVTSSIGSLKKEACSYATGEVLVEVDHDDLLTINCLEELNKVFEEQPEIGFVYSNNAKLSDNFVPYNNRFGWTYDKFNFNGKELISMNSFEPTAYRMSYIWFMPDHVRAWRKSVYDKIGGHNSELEVCDDQELMIRTYLYSKFYHIKKTLYIYRIPEDNSNTSLKRNKEIQKITKELHNKYFHDLIDRYTFLEGLYNKKRNQKVDISIITPTFNRPLEIIQRNIDSVKSQTFTNYEHIICSDGYDERVKDLVEKQNDSRIHYFSKNKTGEYGNYIRQSCLNAAHGEYVVFLDDDNIIFSNYLQVMHNNLVNTSEEIGFAICDIVHNGPLIKSLGKPPVILKGEPVKVQYIDTLQVMCKKEALLSVGGWNIIKNYYADGYTFERLNKYYKYVKVREVLGLHI